MNELKHDTRNKRAIKGTHISKKEKSLKYKYGLLNMLAREKNEEKQSLIDDELESLFIRHSWYRITNHKACLSRCNIEKYARKSKVKNYLARNKGDFSVFDFHYNNKLEHHKNVEIFL